MVPVLRKLPERGNGALRNLSKICDEKLGDRLS